MKEWNELLTVLQERLTIERFEHCLGVVGVAGELARRYGYDLVKAELAGLLHDYARDMGERELLEIAKKNRLKVHPVEYQVPILLHGPVGAFLVQQELGIEDLEILEAIRWHTTGFPGMSGVAQIVYLADIIEPSRDFDGVEKLRILAQQNLHTAVMAAIDCSIGYCLKRGLLIHPISIEARNEMLGRIKTSSNYKEGCY